MHDLDITKGNFTIDELIPVLEKLKTRKAAGLNDITPETWETGAFNDILLDSCNAVYNEHPIVNGRKAVFYHSRRKTIWL